MAVPSPSLDGLRWAGLVGLVGLVGGFLLVESAYRVSPLVLPILLLVGAFAAATFRRPVVGVAGGLLGIALELAALPLPSGALSPSEGAFALVGVGYILRLFTRPESVVAPRLRDASILALLLAYAAGYAIALDPSPVLRITILWALFFCVYLQCQSFTTAEMRVVLISFAVGAGILGVIGAVKYLSAGAPTLYEGGLGTSTRAIGTFVDPNYYASILALAIIPALALILLRPRSQWWLAVAAAGGTAGVVFSLSRGGVLALGSGVLALLIWRKARRVGAVIVVCLLVLFLFNADPLANSSQVKTVQTRLATITNPALEATNLRPRIWATAIAITADHPVFGIGLRGFRVESTKRILFERGTGVENVHNIPLNFAAENGLVGLGGFLTFVIQLFVRGRRALRTRDPLAYAIALGIVASFVGFFVQGMTQMQLRVNIIAAAFFTLGGILTALSDRTVRAAQPIGDERNAPRPITPRASAAST